MDYTRAEKAEAENAGLRAALRGIVRIYDEFVGTDDLAACLYEYVEADRALLAEAEPRAEERTDA